MLLEHIFLMGLALENVIKGFLINKDLEVITSGRLKKNKNTKTNIISQRNR